MSNPTEFIKHPELTKRELFAMAAMQGMIANSEIYKVNSSNPSDKIIIGVVTTAITYADQLLKQLES